LRYEYDTYQELQKDLPPVGSEILTSEGKGRVLAQEILASQILVEGEDSRRFVVPGSDVLTVLKRGSGSLRRPRERPAEVSGDQQPAETLASDKKSRSESEKSAPNKDESPVDE